VLVLIVIAAVVIAAAVVVVATGRGGGLSAERNDYLSLDLGPVSATDVALLRPPTGLWGYNMQATDEALELIAESIRERDVRIVALEQLVTDLSRDHAPAPVLGSPYPGARHRRGAVDTGFAGPGFAGTGLAGPGLADTGFAGTGFADTGFADTGETETVQANADLSGVPPEESHD
jgi:hypothetical protein